MPTALAALDRCVTIHRRRRIQTARCAFRARSGSAPVQSLGGLDPKTREYVERLAKEFPFFLSELWREIGLKSIPKHHKEIAEYLQHGTNRRGILAWRGASKTWVTIAYCCWRLFTNARHERITYVSKSERAAKESLYLARKWIGQARFLQHLVPDRKSGQRDSALMFDVNGTDPDRTPSFCAYGITGQITGSRSTCIVADDVETSENTLTLDMRKRLRDQVAEFENILIPGGDVVYLGTPHHEETLYEHLIRGGYRFMAWPVSHPGEAGCGCQLGPMFADMEAGDLCWPERFGREELAAREAAEGRSKYQMQYLLTWKVGDENRTPLRLADFIVFAMDRDKAPMTIAWGATNSAGQSTRIESIPSLGFGTDGYQAPIMFDKDWAKYTGTRMWVDPSGKGEDETAFAIVSHMNGYLWCKAVGGLPGGYSPSTLDELVQVAKRHGVTELYVEDNFGQGMMAQLLEPYLQREFTEPGTDALNPDGWACSVETVRVSGQKETRIIDNLEPILNQHRLVIHPEVAQDEVLQHQLTRITRQRGCLDHDDRVEALAMAVWLWKKDMAQDPERAVERSRQRAIEDELRRVYSEYSPKGRRWFNRQ